MSVLLILILASLALALLALGGFIWAVRSGQFEDTLTPSMRLLFDEPAARGTHGRGSTLHAAPPAPEKLPARSEIPPLRARPRVSHEVQRGGQKLNIQSKAHEN